MKENLLHFSGHQFEKFHLIQNEDVNAGFCALLIYALNGIRKSLENNYLPIIYFDKFKTSHFYEASYGENIWEYFFNPVMGISSKEFDQFLKKGWILKSDIHTYSAKEIMEIHQYDPDRIATFWAWEEPTDKAKWMSEKRTLGREYVKRYVRVKLPILEKVDTFLQNYFQSKYIFGVHIRGTDFRYAAPTPIESYFNELEKLSAKKKLNDFQIFLLQTKNNL